MNTFHQAGLAGSPDWAIYVAAISVIVRNNWPTFLRFHGGKGAATILGISLVMLPAPTLIALVAAILVIALTKNVVICLGVAFILVNVLAITTSQGLGPIALCIFLSLMVLVAYGEGIRAQLINAIKTRQLRGIFYGRNLNP